MKDIYRIIGRTNGVGLDRDATLLREALQAAGAQTEFAHCRARSWWKLFFPSSPDRRFNIHLERIHARWLGSAQKNILIPNQERFPARQLPLLRKIDEVWCKTRHAEEIFKKLGCRTRFISFTSPDQKIQGAEPDFSKFFHLAGRSTEKGTPVILAAWERHPEWPTLTLLQHADNAPKRVPPNVALITTRLSDDELKRLENEHGIHLCPSRCEGWGHYIAEGMSVGAVVVTTAAPPMNELVGPNRGILISFCDKSPRKLGVAFDVSVENIEAGMRKIFELTDPQKRELSQNARAWFEKNRAEFTARIKELVAEERI
jgi:glycosyltransferase involved in cell wall biosynthesis